MAHWTLSTVPRIVPIKASRRGRDHQAPDRRDGLAHQLDVLASLPSCSGSTPWTPASGMPALDDEIPGLDLPQVAQCRREAQEETGRRRHPTSKDASGTQTVAGSFDRPERHLPSGPAVILGGTRGGMAVHDPLPEPRLRTSPGTRAANRLGDRYAPASPSAHS